MTQSNSNKIFKGGLWITASFVLVRASQLISQIILARLLSPHDFGIWAMVLLVTTLSSQFKDMAVAGVLVYRGLDDRKVVNAVYSLGINLSIGMCVLQALSGFALSKFFDVSTLLPLTACVSLVFLVGAGAGSHGAVMQRQMKFKELAICEAIAACARLGAGLICAGLGGGVWSFAVAEVAAAFVDSILKRILSGYRFEYKFISKTEANQEVYKYIRGLIGTNLAVYVNTNTDNLIIGKLLGANSLGYYNLAYQLAMLPVFALSQINRINFSVLTQQDEESRRRYVHQALELYALVSAPTFAVAFVAAPWLIPLLLGAKWIAAVRIFQIVLIFAYARGFMSILGTVLNAINKPGVNAAINWALVPLSVPSYWFGAQLGGTVGVAAAVACVMGVGATLWVWVATCYVAQWRMTTLLKPVLLPTLVVLFVIILITFTPLSTSPIFLQVGLLIVVYSLAMFNRISKANSQKLKKLLKINN